MIFSKSQPCPGETYNCRQCGAFCQKHVKKFIRAAARLETREQLERNFYFYRAMHFSAKRGIAIACRLSVRLSVCNFGEL